MRSISDLVAHVQVEWGSPRSRDSDQPLDVEELFACRFDIHPAELSELEIVPESIPDDLHEFWGVTRRGVFFLDTVYGQWGLEILSPTDAVKQTQIYRDQRPREIAEGDLIIGLFRGDSDQLMIRSDRSIDDYGSVMIVLPIYPRQEWTRVSENLREFLNRLSEDQGKKYWA